MGSNAPSVVPSAAALSAASAEYIAELYARYQQGELTEPGWAELFAEMHDEPAAIEAELRGATWAPTEEPAPAVEAPVRLAYRNGHVDTAPGITQAAVQDSLRALMFIRAYRVRGHLKAKLDPLGLEKRRSNPELDPSSYGFGAADMDRSIFIDGVLGMERATLRQISERLQRVYCGPIGIEFMHIQDPEQKSWIQERVEGEAFRSPLSTETRQDILKQLIRAEGLEKFLQVKYTGTKRFGLDGGESLIPCMETILWRAAELGVSEVMFGMAHRGRLNMLTNVLGKSYRALFSEFQGNSANPEDVQGSGDVKYHLGTSADREFGERSMHVSLTANPSHLEAVNPVVLGKVRAKQNQRGDTVARSSVLGILLHGDAAMAGQGLVPETLLLSELKGYRTGGTVHVVINNQIGFTTTPTYARSGPYCTEIAKAVQAPILHVNGDDPEAVQRVSRLAMDFRQRFGRDIVIDLICYRRFGHNEGDEPAFTQPLMYKAIAGHTPVRALYAEQLDKAGIVPKAESDAMVQSFQQMLEDEFKAGTAYLPNKADWLEGKWAGMTVAGAGDRRGDTAVGLDLLRTVGKTVVTTPPSFNLNPKIARQLKAKAEMFESGQGFDWATAEAMAFGSLVAQGTPVRLSGQDVGRGTFSQRHAILYDQTTEQRYISLQHVTKHQANFEVHDSPLSEAGVLGFEYGYTLAEPHALVLWEAQFGDFANGAQVIIDQFISSGEAKWLRMSGLVMLLPHGYEGQGPEHSSARLERYLQLSGEDNWQVANCTTPANYFHILRRQVQRDFRKPLVIVTPKSLLRHKAVVSKLEDFGPGSSFHRVLGEQEAGIEPSAVKRVVLCSGKVYYDLLAERQSRGLTDVALLRLEQLYPFPAEPLATELAKYKDAEIVWCQEEPANMGAWFFVDRRIEAVLTGLKGAAKRPLYVGRDEAASPATGLLRRHNHQQAKLVDEALTVKR